MLTTTQVQRASAIARCIEMLAAELCDTLANEDEEPTEQELRLQPAISLLYAAARDSSAVIGRESATVHHAPQLF